MPDSHQIWLEAHYALGKLEVGQGFVLGWRERGEFLRAYIAEHTPVTGSEDKIESTIQPPTEERNG